MYLLAWISQVTVQHTAESRTAELIFTPYRSSPSLHGSLTPNADVKSLGHQNSVLNTVDKWAFWEARPMCLVL